jgi:predicted amidophosphoribosyltransferase
MTVKSVDGIWPRLQRVVLPPHCLLCGGDGDGGRDLCSACAASLLRNPICCPRCALPLQVRRRPAGECLQRPPFEAAFALFLYAHPLTC